APIVLAGDEHEPVGVADLASEPLKGLRRFASRIFLVHPVEHREVDRLGVDQLDVFAAAPQPLDHKLGEPDTHPIGTIGAIEDENAVAHIGPPLASASPVCARMMYFAQPRCSGLRWP